jgi:hypothetical protein
VPQIARSSQLGARRAREELDTDFLFRSNFWAARGQQNMNETKAAGAAASPANSLGVLQERLSFIGLDEKTLSLLHSNKPLIERELQTALDRFYKIIEATPAVRSMFADNVTMQRAKSAQMRHWQSFTSGKLDEAYVSNVRRIGYTHARIGLEPRW